MSVDIESIVMEVALEHGRCTPHADAITVKDLQTIASQISIWFIGGEPTKEEVIALIDLKLKAIVQTVITARSLCTSSTIHSIVLEQLREILPADASDVDALVLAKRARDIVDALEGQVPRYNELPLTEVRKIIDVLIWNPVTTIPSPHELTSRIEKAVERVLHSNEAADAYFVFKVGEQAYRVSTVPKGPRHPGRQKGLDPLDTLPDVLLDILVWVKGRRIPLINLYCIDCADGFLFSHRYLERTIAVRTYVGEFNEFEIVEGSK